MRRTHRGKASAATKPGGPAPAEGKSAGSSLNRFTDDEIIGEIRRLAEMTGGRRLTELFFGQHARVSAETVSRRFGNWNEAIRQAGIPSVKLYPCSDEKYFQNLLALWTHYGRQPTNTETNRAPSEIKFWAYRKRWDKWSQAVAAFLEYVNSDPHLPDDVRLAVNSTRGVPRKEPKHSNEHILSEIRRLAKVMGDGPLTKRFFEDHAEMSHSEAKRRFGSWRNALEAAGVPLRKRRNTFSKEECFRNLADMWMRLGRLPTSTELNGSGSRVKWIAYYYRWRSRKAALSAFREYVEGDSGFSRRFRRSVAAVVEGYRGPRSRERYTSDSILVEIRRVYREQGGRILSMDLFEKHSAISHNTVRKHVGPWREALEKAGVPLGKGQKICSQDECYQNLLELWGRHGRQPTKAEMTKPPSKVALQRYELLWGNWTKAVDAFLERVGSDPALSADVRALIHAGRRVAPHYHFPKGVLQKWERQRVQALCERQEEHVEAGDSSVKEQQLPHPEAPSERPK